jgi:hypothetical protein
LCWINTWARPARPVRGQPLARLGGGGVEEEAAALEIEDARRQLEGAADALLGENDRRAESLDRAEEEPRGIRVELRGRLVEQEQVRLEGERRGEGDTLELAAGELGRPATPQVERSDRLERTLDARADLRRRRAEVLEPEGDLVLDERHHDLVLGILEDGRDRPGEIRGAGRARVLTRDHHPSGEATAVEVRDEPGEGAQERRLPGAGGPEERDDLAGLELERDRPETPGRARVRELELAHHG